MSTISAIFAIFYFALAGIGVKIGGYGGSVFWFGMGLTFLVCLHASMTKK